MNNKLLTQHHLEFQSLKGGCTGSSESTLVKMPHCWKSHVVAHLKLPYTGGDPVLPAALSYSLKKFEHNFLFDLILYVPSIIFQLNRDGSSWVEPVLS